MTCHHVKLPDGVTAIVCMGRQKKKRCQCGAAATLLCDWKIGDGKTCDRPVCHGCAEEVAKDKHLCQSHQVDYRVWLDTRQQRT